MELTNTNRSRAYPILRTQIQFGFSFQASSLSIYDVNARLVAIAEGFHTYPSRTRPLSPPAPMVLGPKGPGRVGRRQADNHITRGIFFALNIDVS